MRRAESRRPTDAGNPGAQSRYPHIRYWLLRGASKAAPARREIHALFSESAISVAFGRPEISALRRQSIKRELPRLSRTASREGLDKVS